MPPAGFEPTISASEQPQTHAVDRMATEISHMLYTVVNYAQCCTTTVIITLSPCCTLLFTKYEYLKEYSHLFFYNIYFFGVYDNIFI
jgi:hypothetical protein